jgi:hypothetical protein
VHAEGLKAQISFSEIYYLCFIFRSTLQIMVFSAGGWQEKHNAGSELLL